LNVSDCRIIWGIIPDFWSISGSGLILGGAIWVAVAKSRIKVEHPEDLERNEYVALDGEEHDGKLNEFELGELSDDEEDHVGASSSSHGSPRGEMENGDTNRDTDNMIVAGDGEFSEVHLWNAGERE
jgi:hypothetical protein